MIGVSRGRIIVSRLPQGNHPLIGPADPFSDSLLTTCATNLGTCTTDLTQTQADLATCQADLAVCQAEMQGAFPGDGVTGPALSYWDNGDGTITDLNTRRRWEKKVEGSGCLHCMDDVYTWFAGTGR